MKTLLINSFAIFIILTIASCGGKVKEAKDSLNNIKNLADAADNISKEMEEANEKLAERRDKGDTLALHYEDLAKYLPESVGDYQKVGDLDGGTTNMAGMGSFSNVSQNYENSDGHRLEINILDYNAAQMMFVTAMAAYASGFSVDTPENMMKGLEISDEIKGWQEFKKKSKKSTSVVGIANRFYVQVEADNQENTDFTNSVIEDDIEIDELASM